jgi:hypothetical protein
VSKRCRQQSRRLPLHPRRRQARSRRRRRPRLGRGELKLRLPAGAPACQPARKSIPPASSARSRGRAALAGVERTRGSRSHRLPAHDRALGPRARCKLASRNSATQPGFSCASADTGSRLPRLPPHARTPARRVSPPSAAVDSVATRPSGPHPLVPRDSVDRPEQTRTAGISPPAPPSTLVARRHAAPKPAPKIRLSSAGCQTIRKASAIDPGGCYRISLAAFWSNRPIPELFAPGVLLRQRKHSPPRAGDRRSPTGGTVATRGLGPRSGTCRTENRGRKQREPVPLGS